MREVRRVERVGRVQLPVPQGAQPPGEAAPPVQREAHQRHDHRGGRVRAARVLRGVRPINCAAQSLPSLLPTLLPTLLFSSYNRYTARECTQGRVL